MSGLVLLVTLAMGAYMVFYQPRTVQNPMRAFALAALLASMLLVAQLAGIGTVPLLVFGVAPTILVTMILTIAYDHRFAMGIGSLHAVLVSAALDQGVGFFLIIWLGVMATTFLLDEVRTRGKLVEVGAVAALAMALGAGMVGTAAGEPVSIIGQDCLYVSAGGLGVGFIVLGILPFIEHMFRVTTSMTLLEIADASHPLLRRLSMEAPGTYAHSLQVATLAEAAAEAIGANSLLCRVGSYYHDLGKMHKADYFIENQFEGPNRHINLSPATSMLIITAHIKDGVELAREYNLPPVLLSLIQQHHGTTLVEYFYHQACRQGNPLDPAHLPVSDVEYRYAGPKPRSVEAVILMLADIVESAARAMNQPTAAHRDARPRPDHEAPHGRPVHRGRHHAARAGARRAGARQDALEHLPWTADLSQHRRNYTGRQRAGGQIGLMNKAKLDLDIAANTGRAYVAFVRRHLISAHRLLRSPVRELSLALVGESLMSRLHDWHMDISGPTDVLSFELDHDARGRVIAGEVIICVSVARRMAARYGMPVRNELLLYAVHGLLHLSGYDDKTDKDYRKMHRMEDRLLSQLGIGPVFKVPPVPSLAVRRRTASESTGGTSGGPR